MIIVVSRSSDYSSTESRQVVLIAHDLSGDDHLVDHRN